MQFKTQQVDDVLVLMIEGKLLSEQETAGIKEQISNGLDGAQKKFIFDLKGIEFVNSACLNFLVSSKTMVSGKSGQMVLCNLPEQLKKLLTVTKLESFFTTANKTSDALDVLRTG
jgi:anti-anti-sigma factor